MRPTTAAGSVRSVRARFSALQKVGRRQTAALGSSSRGSAPLPEFRGGRFHRRHEALARPVRQPADQDLGPGANRGDFLGHHPQHRMGGSQAGGVEAVETQGGRERGEGELVAAQGPHQRVPGRLPHESGLSGD